MIISFLLLYGAETWTEAESKTRNSRDGCIMYIEKRSETRQLNNIQENIMKDMMCDCLNKS